MRVVRIASLGAALAAVGIVAPTSSAKPVKLHVEVVSVRALPAAAQRGQSKGLLDPANLNTVAATNGLAFRVVVHNVTADQQTNVHVFLTINRPASMGGPTIRKVTLGTLPANTMRAVTFTKIGEIPFDSRTSLLVAVPNGAGKVYPVVFTLPSGNSAPKSAPTSPIRRPPRVVGLGEQSALQKLEAAGFAVLIEPVYSSKPKGRVLGIGSSVRVHALGVKPTRQVVEILVSNGRKH